MTILGDGTATAIETPTVLFVDDEEGVLAGLRTSLHRLRRSYRFHFALGAAEALGVLERETIDVVVTDMRMPETNGLDLLRLVKDHHPDVIRYVLSGEAEQELVIQAVPVAHRWLTKPCDRETLTEALSDAVQHRALLADPVLRAVLAGVTALSTPPALYAELQELLADDEVSIAAVASLVGRDAAISAKLLQWANSAFAGGHRSNDLETAVVRIGLGGISQMVLLAGVFKALGPRDAIPGLPAEVLRHHAGHISAISAELARPEDASTARLGGLLSSVGLLIEATHLPDRLADSYDLAARTGVALVDAERSLYGVCHPELGAHLLSIWGIPSAVVVAVAGSHDPPRRGAVAPLDSVTAVQAARLVAQCALPPGSLGPPHVDGVDDVLAQCVDRWQASVATPNRVST